MTTYTIDALATAEAELCTTADHWALWPDPAGHPDREANAAAHAAAHREAIVARRVRALRRVTTAADGWAGQVHGDDDRGRIDVTFPSMEDALAFIDATMGRLIDSADIRRGDEVTSLYQPVTLTVRPTDFAGEV